MRYRVRKTDGRWPWLFEPVDPEAAGDYGSLATQPLALKAANTLARNDGQWPLREE